jgi:hypothetical protein
MGTLRGRLVTRPDRSCAIRSTLVDAERPVSPFGGRLNPIEGCSGHRKVTSTREDERVPYLFTPRGLALLTAASVVLSVWALVERSVLAVPLSVVCVLAAFGWSLARIHAEPAGVVPAAERVCSGCRAGCVECRERIDLPA